MRSPIATATATNRVRLKANSLAAYWTEKIQTEQKSPLQGSRFLHTLLWLNKRVWRSARPRPRGFLVFRKLFSAIRHFRGHLPELREMPPFDQSRPPVSNDRPDFSCLSWACWRRTLTLYSLSSAKNH